MTEVEIACSVLSLKTGLILRSYFDLPLAAENKNPLCSCYKSLQKLLSSYRLTIITLLQDQTKKEGSRRGKEGLLCVIYFHSLPNKARGKRLFLDRCLLQHIKHFSWAYVRDILLQRLCPLHSQQPGCLSGSSIP